MDKPMEQRIDEWADVPPPTKYEQRMGLLILFVVFIVAFMLGYLIR